MSRIETIECRICGSQVQPLAVLDNVKDGWHIRRCPVCAVAFVDPQPRLEQITSYYDGMYHELATEFSEQKMSWAIASVKGYLDCLGGDESHGQKSLLDLGGGLGYYSKAFQDAGLETTLVEQDPVSFRFATQTLQLKDVLRLSADEFFRSNEKKYDIVFLRHVIEHSMDPLKMIHGIGDCLKENGVLILETDNNAGVELLFRPGTARFYLKLYQAAYSPHSFFSLIKRRPFAVDPPRHLFGFRASNLALLLRRGSFTPFKTICYRLGHPVYWPNLPVPRISTMLGNLGRLRFKRVLVDAVDLGLFPLRLLLEKLGLAAGICIYARKQSLSQPC